MFNNFEGRELLSKAPDLETAIRIVNENNLSDLDVRCSLNMSVGPYDFTKYYKTLSSILPYSSNPHATPQDILGIILKNNVLPASNEEKDIILNYLGGTDDQIKTVLNCKDALNCVATPVVHQILKGNYELTPEETMNMMKENYLWGVANGQFDKDTLKNFDASLFASMLHKITRARDKSYSGAMPNLGLTEEEAVDFCVKSVIKECGIFTIVPQSNNPTNVK